MKSNIYVNFLWLYTKMSSNNSFKRFPVQFWIVQKHSIDCALTKNVRTISNLNNSKTTKKCKSRIKAITI